MDELQQKVLKEITEAINDINEQKAIELVEFLTGDEVGVRSLDSLFDVPLDILSSKISHCDANKLHRIWKVKFNPPQTAASRQICNLNATHVVNWSKIPQHIIHQLEQGKWLSKADRCMLVRLVVLDTIAQKGDELRRDYFKNVAKSMVQRYEASLGDRVNEKPTKKSNYYQAKLQFRFDEIKRPINQTNESPNIPEAHGCVRWRVQIPKEKRPLLLSIKEKMLETFANTIRKDWDWDLLLKQLEETYPLQREDINGQTLVKRKRKATATTSTDQGTGPSCSRDPAQPGTAAEEDCKTTTQIAKEWPFLFQKEGMAKHFEILTRCDWDRELKEFDKKHKIADYIEFLASQKELKNSTLKKTMERAQQRNLQGIELLTFILMLLEYYNEERNDILKVVDITTQLHDVEDATTLPSTPCLIAQGPAFRAKKFYFSIDGHVHSMTQTFHDGLNLLFSSYFVFNIKYANKAGNTLDFLQRVIAEINPKTGTKVDKTSIKFPVSEKLQTLLDKHETWVRQKAEAADDNIDDDLLS